MHLLKSIALAAALACVSVGAASCGSFQAITGDCSGDPICTAQKTLTTGYNAHDTAVKITKANHDSGALVGTNYTEAVEYLDTAKSWLDKAYAVVHTAGTFDAALFNSDMGSANDAQHNADAIVQPAAH